MGSGLSIGGIPLEKRRQSEELAAMIQAFERGNAGDMPLAPVAEVPVAALPVGLQPDPVRLHEVAAPSVLACRQAQRSDAELIQELRAIRADAEALLERLSF